MIVKGKNIAMSQGDSESVSVSIKNGTLEAGDVIEFAIKRNKEACCNVFYKRIDEFEDGKAVIRFYPEDTADIPIGSYVYDVVLSNEEKDLRKTLIEAAQFNLT